MRSKEAGVGSWKVGIAIAFGLLGMLSGVATAAPKARPEGEPARIILRVHDYAGVPSKVLAEGLVETAKILHAAGVEVSIVVQDFNNVPRSSFGANGNRSQQICTGRVSKPNSLTARIQPRPVT